VQLRNLLDLEDLHLSLLTGAEHLDRPIRWVVTTDMPDPSRYLAGDELVLTGLVWRRSAADSEPFVAALAASGVSALAAGDAALGAVPDDLVEACRRYRVPLFEVPIDVAFATVTEAVVRRLSAQRAGDLATVLDRHRRLLSAGSEAGGGLDAVLDLVSRDLGLACWVLSPTGRRVAGPASLPPGLELRLAREFLHADRLPAVVTPDGDRVFSVLPVRPGQAHRITDWCVVVESDARSWATERRHLVEELVALVGAEREELARRLRNPLASELVELVMAGAETAAFLPQLRACGLDPDGPHLVIVAAAPDGVAAEALDELLRPVAPRVVVGPAGAGAAGLVPVGDGGRGDAVERIRTAVHALEPGLGALRLHVGVSGVAAGARGLRGAAEEARYACQLAALRPGRAAVVGDDELSSHLLLLAGVPDDLRRTFRERVLGPVDDYDRQHRSDLVPTLRAFLDGNCSWTRCAELLHVHVNTLRYRIERIEQLTGRDLSTLPDRVDLFLALRLD
jgi:DNA-binding PucR family transcriptional regulator